MVDARPPLRHEWWGKARGCPSPACLQRSWWSSTPLFVLWSDRHFVQKAARRQIWHRSKTTNRMCATVASVEYPDACMARGSQPVGGQDLQPVCLQHTLGLICSQGVRGYLSAQASVRNEKLISFIKIARTISLRICHAEVSHIEIGGCATGHVLVRCFLRASSRSRGGRTMPAGTAAPHTSTRTRWCVVAVPVAVQNV